ncbi:MAG: hypothetical protein ACKV2U_31795 [Bryobacteraceae bacterium]
MKELIVKLCNILVPFVMCAGLSLAQQPGNPPAVDPNAAAKAMTGCLAKGVEAGEFVLTNENGQKINLTSSTDLSKHVDHKIRVSGSATKQQDKMVFRVDAVEHLADTCK